MLLLFALCSPRAFYVSLFHFLQAGELKYYANKFPAVEINTTFHGLPKVVGCAWMCGCVDVWSASCMQQCGLAIQGYRRA